MIFSTLYIGSLFQVLKINSCNWQQFADKQDRMIKIYLFISVMKINLGFYVTYNIVRQNKMNNSKLRSVSNRGKSNSVYEKTLLSKNQPLEIIPSEVVFKEIEVNQYYEITVEIRNLTTKAIRIRIMQTNNPNFKVIYTKQPEIAPGLSMTAKVKYECKELKNETQVIKIMSEDGHVMELPVRVYKTQSQILFEPFVNMGFLKLGKQHVETISIKNSGKANSIVEFSHAHGTLLSVQPKILKIAPMQQQKLTVKYKPTEAGLFKGVINLKSDSILVKDTIDIHATAVQFARFVVDDKGSQTTSFDFGTLFIGQESTIRAFVVNNSPKKMKFKSFFRKGYLSNIQQFALIQTPYEIGNQQCERTMFVQPESGQVDAFAEFQIKLICKTRISYKDKIFTNNYALTPSDQEGAINSMKNSADFKPQNIHEYSILVNVEEDEPMVLQLKANAVCPTIKLNENIFKFGDCSSKQIREIGFFVENKSNQVKTQINFPKIPNFAIRPQTYTLKPLQKHQFKAVFEPKTIGKIDTTQILLINKLYEIQMRCFGISISGPGGSRAKDPISSKEIPSPNSKLIEPVKTRSKAFSLTDKAFMSEMRRSAQEEEKMKIQFTNLSINKDKYNQVLIDRRTQRAQNEKQEQVQKKWSLYQSKLKDLGIASKIESKLDDEGLPENAPIDYQFETGMVDTKLVKQNIPLPQSKQKLFVTRHILDYEPTVSSTQQSNAIQKFHKDFRQVCKKMYPDTPQNYNHRRQISQELTPEELSQIEVSSNVIQFGQVYIKSSSKGYFWVKNASKKTISMQLIYRDQQLSQSYKKMQILPSSAEAGFEIVFTRDTLGDFRSTIKYLINSVHEFQMTITAKCVPVCVDIDKSNLKFLYDESSVEMSTKQIIKLSNPGNSDAVFKFTLGKQRLFVPSVVEGRIPAKQTTTVHVTFTPPEIKTQKAEYNFTERLILKVLDGPQVPLVCTTVLYDPKFTIKPLTNPNPTLCLGHKLEDVLEIKNVSKQPIILHIQGKVLQINEKVRISPEQVKKFKVRFASKEIGNLNGEISIQPRCGIPKLIQVPINVIQPKITFSKQEIDFGVLVIQSIVGKSNLTLTNETDIQMPLIFDLRPQHLKESNPKGIQSLTIKLLNSDEQFQVVGPSVKTEQSPQKKLQNGENIVGMEVNEEDLDNSQESQEQVVQKNQDQLRRFKLNLKPKKVYQFSVQFFPKDITKYQFELPLAIQGSKAEIKNAPVIICQGIKPQFIFEPSIVDFKRKIVTKPERSYPKFINITISNLNEGECLWELHDDDLKKDGIFVIEKNKGELKGKETIQVRASFNPYAVGQFQIKMPLFIKNKTLPQPLKYVDVIFKGTASLPNLFFNKREVIMPVVPLDIETTSSFKILNDGYQNCNLKCQFLDDVADLGVKVLFPEGNNIGITRQKLKVDLLWKYHKPISFCLKLQFTDDLNRTFVIPVSGTTDNCIFTNYTYFLRNQNKYNIKAQGALKLVQTGEQNQPLARKNSSHSLRSNVTGKSVMSYLGVNPISPAILSNTLDYINRYLNANLLTTPIKQFPVSLIESDGNQVFQILSFVSNKSSNFPWKYSPVANDKPLNRVTRLFNQYNQLVKMLKIEGAQLNHIRPEYLLSFSDLNIYLSNLPAEKSKFFMPSLLKINNSLFNYLSLESWITLLYQIFKIYILARVTVKNFKSHLPSLPDIPKVYLDSSNFISTHQSLIFYWVEQAILQILLEERRLTNFDKDFKDGIAIGALLQKYSGINVLKKMKMVCTTQQDFRQNAQIVCQGLAEIGMQNHITPKDIWSPLQRQMLLFILHLYVYLPFYVPKQQPIVFKCILGQQVVRAIQLTNPSSKAVTYQVRYEGSQDFKLLSETKFRIEPKQIYKFQVKFVSRISSPVKGKIMFINLKQNSLTAAALVFELQSEIVGRTSDRIWNISGILYEQVQFTVDVFNKFTSAEMVDFTISYQTEYIFDKNKSKNPGSLLPKQQQIQTIYGKQENVKIRKNGTASLTLNYLPMSMYTTKTTIFFLNPIIGQFQHQIIAGVEPPGTVSQIRPPMTLSVDQIVNWQFQINPKNQQINRAKKVIQGLKKGKKGAASKQKTQQAPQTLVNQTFYIEIAPNPYINAKQSIVISEKQREQKKNAKEEIVDSQNKVPFTIICKNPVYQFSTYILLANKSKTDVRRYKVIFTVQPKPLKAILQMNVPARGEVTQNLPIVNNTERDWNIKVQWQPDSSKNGNYFIISSQYSSSFPVKRNSIGNFPITFKPKWAHEAQAKLTLSNPLTLDLFEYQILGHGEEPLAEEHIEIKCQAKEIIKKEIIIKNPYNERPVSFNVETDLMNCNAPKKLNIASGGKQKFQFTVQPMLCGQYTGSITFFQDDGPQYLWYTISVVTNYPEAYKSLAIQTQIRQKILTEIHIPYQNKQESSFQVIINGTGLSGDPTCTVKPNYDNIYILEYLPLEVGSQKGSICFINPGVGQVLFELQLKCDPKHPIVINNLKSPLGVSTSIFAQLENPTPTRTIIKVNNTNSEQFVIKSHNIRLQPNEKKKVQIQYIPSSLDTLESAKISFVSKDIGDWHYELSGSGQMPVPYPIYSVFNGLLEQHSDSVKFKNPFKYQIVVGIKLIDESEKGIFKIISHGKTRFQIDSSGLLEVPFSFVPTACKMYSCKIIVMISQKIFWTFPIKGVTEVNQGKIIANLISPCRQTATQFVQIALQGVQYTPKNNIFEYSFENIPAQYIKQIQKSLLVEFSKDNLKHAKDTLELQFMFKPMKPVKVGFDLLITKKQGSRWRFRILLEGTDPQPDDIIQIQSNLMVTSTVSFKITNVQKNSAPFKAKFTSDSAHQFSIEPKQGIMAPFGSKGTNFYISYTPVEYGKEKKGKLIIQTADMYWSYLLKGSLPKYVPPKLQASRSRITSDKR